jgi:hypothetical protein
MTNTDSHSTERKKSNIQSSCLGPPVKDPDMFFGREKGHQISFRFTYSSV